MGYYVALTGSKNNAGDFLIKHRAAELLAALRPDRTLVDRDGWKPMDADALAQVNGAQALLLLGGPALQAGMRPDVYALPEDLDAIRVPIVTMGIGWKSPRGDWADTYDYPLSAPTLQLLERVRAAGVRSGVRDFRTLNVLQARGHDNYLMTGCPAYYDLARLGTPAELPARIGKVAFSTGVTFVHSAAMATRQRAQILRVRDRFRDAAFEVAFHHALAPEVFLSVYPRSERHVERHARLAEWLAAEGIRHVDIAGSAQALIDYYRGVDLHVGYRVHAHIFMTSQSRPSVLIAEDGRGKATREVAGDLVVDGFTSLREGRLARTLARRLPLFDRYTGNVAADAEVIARIDYELASGGQRLAAARRLLDTHFETMRAFLAQLP